MNDLVTQVRSKLLNKSGVGLRLPVWLGFAFGRVADVFSRVFGKKLPLSSIRVRKFISSTSFSALAAHSKGGFIAPVKLEDGINATLESEFLTPDPNAIKFYTE